MGHAQRWIVLPALSACVVGAAVALWIAAPRTQKTSVTTATKTPSASATAIVEARATRGVVEAANSLTVSIAHARNETTSVLASSYAALARSQAAVVAERAQLAAEQRQITVEVQQLTARAAALSTEGVTLQREAAALKAAQVQAVTNSQPNPASAGGASSPFGGDGHDH